MFKAEKILWGEGLFLRPQHFQIQDTYHEQHLNHTIRALIPYSYGIQKLRFDEAQLATHILALEEVEMIWQDGEIYHAPAQDLLPEPLLLDDLNLQGEMIVYLVLPILQANKQNVADQTHSHASRYHNVLTESHDLFTNASPAALNVLRCRAEFKLLEPHLQPTQALDGFLYMAIAKLKRHSSGGFELDQNYIPPVLHIGASVSLIHNLKRTLNVIKAKIKSLQNNNRENEQKLIEFRSGDIVSFWLINALNTAYAGLNHLLQHPQIHPERLFAELLRLTGSLLTFSSHYQVDHLPAYQHHHLQDSFQQLDVILKDLLDTIISSRYFNIALKETRPSYWVGSLESDKITRDTRLYIAVSSSMMQTHELIQIVPVRFKVGSTIDVEQRVVAALPAVPLHHLVQVPTAIPVRSGVNYFEIEAHHELYQRMLESESICVYVPTGFQDISIELIAVMNT